MIRIDNVRKTFDNTTVALDGVNLEIRAHEFMTLLGPSGCGKTTLLRIVAGFEAADEGTISMNGQDMDGIAPNHRQINTVFQNYALFPHLDVYGNIAFGLKIKKLSKEVIDRKVDAMLKLVNLPGYQKRKVSKLSGGQQQRVAIARALVNEPKVLLLDEPLGALDLKLRKQMQIELKKMQQELKITFIYVTHDQEEALTMSDTVVVMKDGQILQQGTPMDIYNEPINNFVADFIGESNIIDAVMIQDRLVHFANTDIPCVDKGFQPDEPVEVVIRPEDIEIVSPADGQWIGTVESIVFKGVHYEMLIRSQDGYQWLCHNVDPQAVGRKVGLAIDPDDIHVMKPYDGDETTDCKDEE